MTATTFDTLRFVEKLEKAGMPREQAVALVEAQKEVLAEALETALATKSDVTSVERRLDGLDAKIDKLSWMLGILIALAVANFAKQFF